MLSSINKVGLVYNFASVLLDQLIKDDPYWISKENTLELIRMQILVKLPWASLYGTVKENSLKLPERYI